MTEKLLNNNFAQVSVQTLPSTDGKVPLEGLKISHSHCTAEVSLYGGQVLSFKPTEQNDILWLSEQALYQEGSAIRGGVPLCWPWFGANDKEKSTVKSGNHGFARQLRWQIESINADESGVTLVLELSGENQHALWPNAYKLKQTLFFGEHFSQRLAMSNLSDVDAQYSAALHSYFRVSNPENVTIDALTGVNYDDKLTSGSGIQQQTVSCVGEIDREYHSRDKMTIIDNNWQRKIVLTSNNCQQWVLWNPGATLASSMADVHVGGEQEYVCLEAANTKWQELPAGKTVTISQEIHVTKL